jgi:hypothetical protein
MVKQIEYADWLTLKTHYVLEMLSILFPKNVLFSKQYTFSIQINFFAIVNKYFIWKSKY